MKAYVTSIGEKTTKVCCEQLKRYGFEVVLLDDKESWFDKYKRFINIAKEDCLRIDADIIPNEKIKLVGTENVQKVIMTQYSMYCFYKNGERIGNPVFYKKKVLDRIREVVDSLDKSRPETAAWRLDNVRPYTLTSNLVVGLHGFFQDDDAVERERDRKGKEYDFNLVDELRKLCQ